MAIAPELTTLPECLSYTGLGETASDVQMGRLQFVKRGVEQMIRNFFGSNIISTTYTQYYPTGNPFDITAGITKGMNILRLKNYPVTSITSINEDTQAKFGTATNAFPSGSLLTEGSDFFQVLEQDNWNRWGEVIRDNLCWPVEPGSIKVVYTAGWTQDQLRGHDSDPDKTASDLHMAILQAIVENYTEIISMGGKGGQSGPIKRERFVDEEYEYDTTHGGFSTFLSTDIKQKLRPYKRFAMAI
jgi:hypothetical protein